MKHTFKVSIILVLMFFIAQMIGIFVAHVYQPEVTSFVNQTTGEIITQEVHNLPYGLEPPADATPQSSAISIVIALVIAIALMLILMKIRAEIFLRVWFFVVVIVGISLALNAFFIKLPNSSIIALIIAIPLAISKVFQRNLVVHNITELLIYPGIAAVFVPLLNIWAAVFLLILISLWDMYAVWHSGVMQKMAKYQMEKVRVFAGFFVPYVRKKDRIAMKEAKKAKVKKSKKKVAVNVAILGGGDVVFPLILAGTVLPVWGLASALTIAICSTISLAILFYYSEKGKFYPAMPFLTTGALIGLGLAYLLF